MKKKKLDLNVRYNLTNLICPPSIDRGPNLDLTPWDTDVCPTGRAGGTWTDGVEPRPYVGPPCDPR